jgi:hypothetical protein
MSEPAEAVRQRARGRCEYCRLPQDAFRRGFHIEHIVANQHGRSRKRGQRSEEFCSDRHFSSPKCLSMFHVP